MHHHYSRSGTFAHRVGLAVTLPKLSIAAKLYAIFALMATTTVALSIVAVHGARSQAALTDAFKSANAGSSHLERITGLLYADAMEQRAIITAPDSRSAAEHAPTLAKIDDQIGATMSNWEFSVDNADAADYSALAVRISEFSALAFELARVTTKRGPEVARAWVEKKNPAQMRDALSKTMESLGHFAPRWTSFSNG